MRLLVPADPARPVAHRVEILSWRAWMAGYLGVDAVTPVTPEHWLVPTEQKLRTLRYGRFFHDGLGLEEARSAWDWYPESVWRQKMALLWQAIADEEPFIGRCGDVGDERGSRLVAARLVDLALHVAFLQEREYAPYSKWFGTAFSRLSGAAELGSLADEVWDAPDWRTREAAFNALGGALVRRHNALALTPPQDDRASPFWGRPYRVIHGDRVAAALRNPLN